MQALDALLTPTSQNVRVALRSLHLAIEQERDEVLGILTEISTRKAAEYEVDSALRTLRGAEEEVDRHRPPRVGTVAVFLPSNVLLYSYVLYMLVPLLYADRVVFRPATHVAETARRLHDLLSRHHRLPVHLEASTQRQFVQKTLPTADVVVFTGAYTNAEDVRATLRDDQVFFFLGSGINPIVVTRTADVVTAVRDIVDIRLLNSGQDCLGPDAIWVDRSIATEVLTELDAQLDAVRYGPYTDPRTDYGSICYPGILRQAADFFCRHDERIRRGGQIDFPARHIEPTVVVWDHHARMEVTEFFAPVFNVVLYDDEHTVATALTSRHYAERAMGASVYGASPLLVEALAQRHTLTVDESLLAIDDGNAPLGGRGPMANYIAVGRTLHPEPVLLSKGLADHRPAGRGHHGAPSVVMTPVGGVQ